MARKQTLKSLLGASDGRVETELNLGVPRLSSTVTPTSGGGVYVGRTPESPLTKVASALGGLNSKLAQYSQDRLRDQESLARIEKLKSQTALTNEKIEFVNTQKEFETFASEHLHTFVAERKNELYKTEDEIDKIFKDEYNLNPLNSKRAQALAGAELRSDFNRHVESGIQKLKEDMINGDGVPLSQDEVNALVDGLVDGFVEDNNISGSVLNGLYQATENDRLVYKTKLTSELTEYHQDNVIIPRVTTALMDIVEGDIENSLNVNGQLVPNRQSTPSRINETLRLAQGLPPEKLLKMMENIENTIDLEDAALGVTTFQQVAAQLKIGNQSYVDTADYQRLAAQLEDKVEKYEAQQNTLFNTRVATHERNQNPIVDQRYTLKGENGGVSGVEAYRQSEIERINKITDPMERKAELEALEKSINGIMVRHDRAIKDISDHSSYNIENGYSNAAVVDIATRLGNELNDVSEGGVINPQNTGLFRTDEGYTVGDQTFTPEAQKVYNNHYTIASTEVTSLKDEIARRVLIGEIDAQEGGALLTEGMRAIHEQFESGVRKDFMSIVKSRESEIIAQQDSDKQKQQDAQDKVNRIDNLLVGKRGKAADGEAITGIVLPFMEDDVAMRMIGSYNDTATLVASGEKVPEGIDMETARSQIVDLAQEGVNSLVSAASRRRRGVAHQGVSTRGAFIRNNGDKYRTMRNFIGYDGQEVLNILGARDAIGQGTDQHGFTYPAGYFDPNTIRINGLDNQQVAEQLAKQFNITVEQLLEAQEKLK